MIAVASRGVRETEARLTGFHRAIPTIQERAVARASVMVRGELVKQMSGHGGNDPFFGRRGASVPLLGVRTGATRARISPGGRVFRRGSDVFSAVGSPDRHVRFHEDGGTIVGNQYLRIPLRAAQTGSGQDRNVGRSVRGLPGTFIVKTMGGRLFIAQTKGGIRSRRVEFLYLLVRSVTLPARRMFATVTERMRQPINALMGSAVTVEVRKANGG